MKVDKPIRGAGKNGSDKQRVTDLDPGFAWAEEMLCVAITKGKPVEIASRQKRYQKVSNSPAWTIFRKHSI